MSPLPTNSNTRLISSFFSPLNKSEEKKHDRPKISVKNILKSNRSSSSSSLRNHSSIPFKFSRDTESSFSNSSSTESLANNLARFRFEGSSDKSSLFDLSTPTTNRLKQRHIFDNDDDDEEEETFRPVLRERKPIKKSLTLFFSSDEDDPSESGDDDDDDDGLNSTTTLQSNKRRRKGKPNHSLFSDSEDEMSDDAEDDAYVDENSKLNKAYDGITEKENIERVQRIYPNKTLEEIQDAVRHAGSVVGACQLLSKNEDIPKPKRSRITIRSSSSSSSDDDDDDDKIQKNSRQQLFELQRERLVLRLFNTGSSKDIQDITGCKPEIADRIIEELRPFSNIEDLEEKLRQAKGMSVKYIQSCQEMMDSYSAVDQIIENIENLGSSLRQILHIWEGADAQDTHLVEYDKKEEEEDDDDENSQPGIHLAKVKVDSNQSSSKEYKDAMDGYLTEQPACVNKEITLKDYQILGVNWMLLLYRKGISGILADEMGLGKTAQVITFLGRLYEIGEKGPHLIIVPSSTIENWVREFDRFCPDLEVRLYHGNIKERAQLRTDLKYENKVKAFQVVLTTYQLASGHIDDRYFLRKLKFRSMILDEGHMVKNFISARYKYLMNINTPFRLLLTGTPLQNNLQELISLLMFIMPETFANYEDEVRALFKIRSATTSSEQVTNGKANETSVQVLSRARILRAKKMMMPFVLRRKKEDVLHDLPKKFQRIEHCDMTQSQTEIYSDIIMNSKKKYNEEEEKGKEKSAMRDQFESMTNIIIHLRKAADHPLLFRKIYTDDLLRQMAKEIRRDVKYWDSDEDYIYEDMTVMSDFELHKLCIENRTIKHHQLKNEEWMDSGKIERLKTLLPQIKKEGNKVLIFSQFTKMLDILELVMETLNISFLRLDGETKVMERQSTIDEFNENEDITVFLLSTKAGGFGINLTSANIVILYDLDFNPQNDKQAEDRAHRVGQKKDVTIYKLISKDSVEEYILKMAEMKLRLDKNVSSKEGEDVVDEQGQDTKQTLQSIIKEAFHLANKQTLFTFI
ncbi:SNF2 family N-terminal domain-containing protein [Cokeromyces recurvatus]|uniref:SNF2 family N-terminal domain-containing protein n=1 Tax=Cokeromyces recurvatus TaxID=90255 RepID=UPI00221FAF67|nr:SNF2 family N-terminal domain-containing protein [Cokeromyces recurvatus]KAI7905409.1 SNF2 family N-terminal domain-containing protein [Cokeromyces recurvatus]